VVLEDSYAPVYEQDYTNTSGFVKEFKDYDNTIKHTLTVENNTSCKNWYKF